MIVLDTSALIRFFTKDDKVKALRVKKLFESKAKLLLIEPVLMELTYTLLKVYEVSKTDVIKVLEFLLSQKNIVASREIRSAVRVYTTNNVSITDCLVVVYTEGGQLTSFDENLLKLTGVKSVWK